MRTSGLTVLALAAAAAPAYGAPTPNTGVQPAARETWEQYGDDWASWGESVGQAYENAYGKRDQVNVRETWEQYGQDWASWGESVGQAYENAYGKRDQVKARETWEQYGDDWASWGESVGQAYENAYGKRDHHQEEGTRRKREHQKAEGRDQHDARETWEQYGQDWANWGKTVGQEYKNTYGRRSAQAPFSTQDLVRALKARAAASSSAPARRETWAQYGEAIGDEWSAYGDEIAAEYDNVPRRRSPARLSDLD